MTDDLKAPERIWLDWPGANKGDPVFDEPPEHYLQAGQTKYVRADVHAAQIADLQRQLAEARESDASNAATQFLYKHGDLTYTAAYNAIALLKATVSAFSPR